MPADPRDGLVAQLRLSQEESVTVHALELRMMWRDIEGERRAKTKARKRARIDAFHQEFVKSVDAALSDQHEPPPITLFDPDVVRKRAQAVTERSRALIILIELMTFNPWFPDLRWDASTRKKSIRTAVEDLGGLTDDDRVIAEREFEALLVQIKRKQIRWGRVAALSVVGLGAGAATAGWAAPAVGALIGGSMGLAGAAATSAGLAMLGGGSIAAGGFGVVGGTILVTGVGGIFGAGTLGTAARFSRVGNAAILADAIKLDLVAKLVLATAEDRDQKIRRVAESLQQRINEFSDKINLLSERISTLKSERDRLTEENRQLREEIAQLREERDNAAMAKAALEVVRDRIPVGADHD